MAACPGRGDQKDVKSNGDLKERMLDAKVAPNIVAAHARYFAAAANEKSDDPPSRLTSESMTNGHTIQKIFSGVGTKVLAILGLIKLAKPKSPPTVETVAAIVNPARSGLWNEKGEFDEVQFEQLSTYARDSVGERVVTRADVQRYLDTKWGNRYFGVATWVYVVVPVFWTAVTKGSFDELFEYYSDHWYQPTNGGARVKAMTLAHLKRFYMDPVSIMRRREKGELPIAKPAK